MLNLRFDETIARFANASGVGLDGVAGSKPAGVKPGAAMACCSLSFSSGGHLDSMARRVIVTRPSPGPVSVCTQGQIIQLLFFADMQAPGLEVGQLMRFTPAPCVQAQGSLCWWPEGRLGP